MKNSLSEFVVQDYNQDSNEVVSQIKSYISKSDCKDLDIDICRLSFMDACKVSTLCSTFHFAKYDSGKINWIVENETIKNTINLLKLKNTKITVKEKYQKTTESNSEVFIA